MTAMRHITRLFVLAALGAVTASCGDVARSGRAPVFLVIDSIGATAGTTGGANGTPSSILQSDVQTMVRTPAPCSNESPCPTIVGDGGIAAFHLSPKDIGTASATASPSSNNQVTLTRYRVVYKRADGRNTPGVDVPYGFDGGITITVPVTGSASTGFELVRTIAKTESPLVQLVNNPTIITTIAEVTFYGQDLVGNAIQATGNIQVDFGNFADR